MRVALVAVGSEGDVAPVVSIATTLARRGHDVRVVALDRYAGMVTGAGLALQSIQTDGSPLWPGIRWLRRAALTQPGVMYATMLASFHRLAPHTNEALLRAAQDADVLVSGTATRGACQALAEASGARHLFVMYAPLLPARQASSTALGVPGLGPRVTHATSRVMWTLTQGLMLAHARDMAERLRGRPRVRRPMETLLATSPVVSPAAGEWPGSVEQVGWIRSTGGRIPVPDEVGEFLAAGSAPVVMTFGSSPVVSPERDREMFVRAARRAGVRLVVPGVEPRHRFADGDVVFTGAVDFDELLPRAAAMVHHGGAGTTYTALASGIPSVVVPHLGDQAYYARRVAELGAGPRGVPRWRLTTGHLARLVAAALDQDMTSRTLAIAEQLTREDGARAVAGRIEGSAAST